MIHNFEDGYRSPTSSSPSNSATFVSTSQACIHVPNGLHSYLTVPCIPVGSLGYLGKFLQVACRMAAVLCHITTSDTWNCRGVPLMSCMVKELVIRHPMELAISTLT